MMIAQSFCAPTPMVSVVVPTFRRPALLRRALTNARAQSFTDWELIVSDDDPNGDDAERVLRDVFRSDPRVRVIVNTGELGQAGNVNNGLRAASGKWIKPLFDDDALKPEALARFVETAIRCPKAVIVRCLTDRVINGRHRGAERLGRRSALELIHQRDAHLAMYLQDLDIGTPTAVLVHRRVIDAGTLFEAPTGISSSVDGWWFIRALRHGDLALCNEPLVEMHQGDHNTITSDTNADKRYAQFELLREWLLPMIDLSHKPPPLETTQGMIRLIHAACEAAHGRPVAGLRQALAERDPRAWRLAVRWALRRVAPGRFEVVQRHAVGMPTTEPRGATAHRASNASTPPGANESGRGYRLNDPAQELLARSEHVCGTITTPIARSATTPAWVCALH